MIGAILVLGSAPAATAATPTWSILQTPRPRHTSTSSLEAVACVSMTDCMAVGNRNYLPLAEHWDGSSWSIEATPAPPDADEAVLFGVACTSSTRCVAVGYFESPSFSGSRTLAERWDGATWTVEPTQKLNDSLLTGTACVRANDCTAVGYFTNRTGRYRALAEHWDGVAWSVVPMPNPPHAEDVAMAGVSCRSATDCTAVGAGSGARRTLPIVEHWDGMTWSVVPSPNPPHAKHSGLEDSDCISGDDCWAVGWVERHGRMSSLVEHWDGISWSIGPAVPPIDGENRLLSIVCTSHTSCMAVGQFDNSKGRTRNLAERWDGSRWEMQRPPPPIRAWSSLLRSVDCISDEACIAVGTATHRKDLSLAERYSA